LDKKISAVGGSEQTFLSDQRKNADIFTSLATGCTMNNTARIDFVDGNFKRVGEPTEAALKVLAEKICGSPVDSKSAFDFEKATKSKLKTIASLDFTSERKAMSTVVTGYKDDKCTLLKGAPDRIIAKCVGYMSLSGGSTPKPMSSDDREKIMKNVNSLAAKGLRCLAIAEIPNAGSLKNLTE
jgi:magnesium-transporting ATPase (P-type)